MINILPSDSLEEFRTHILGTKNWLKKNKRRRDSLDYFLLYEASIAAWVCKGFIGKGFIGAYQDEKLLQSKYIQEENEKIKNDVKLWNFSNKEWGFNFFDICGDSFLKQRMYILKLKQYVSDRCSNDEAVQYG